MRAWPALTAFERSSSIDCLASPICYIFLIFLTYSLINPAKFAWSALSPPSRASFARLFLGLCGWLWTRLADLAIWIAEIGAFFCSLLCYGYSKLDASWMKKLLMLLLLLLIWPIYEICWSDLAKPYFAFSSLRRVMLSMNLLLWLLFAEAY